jgi:predicted helicase
MPRHAVMQHFIAFDNKGLIATRQLTSLNFCHIFCSKFIMEKKAGSHDRATSFFPIYIFDKNNAGLFESANNSRKPNLSPKFIEDIAARLKMKFIPDGKGDRKKTFGPEDIFNYMYAVFHSPTYRSRYSEFLKMDFPRLPLTSKPELFRNLCALGDELVALHLMEKQGRKITSYPAAGDSAVETVRYTEPQGDIKGRVWINTTQYFEGVPKNVWEFHVGGYQVCAKWLKDRKGRKLTYDDLTHYQQIVSALTETIKLMENIDATINASGGWPIT